MTVEEFIAEWRDPSRDYISAHTSGSTGTPKPVRLDKEFVTQSARRTIDYFGIRPGHRLHLPLSCDYIAGKMMVVRSEVSGARLTWEHPTSTPLATDTDLNPVHLLAIVPTQMPWLLDNLNNLPEIRNWLIGGAAISQRLRTRIAEAGLHAFESYGMTETASHVAIRPVSAEPCNFTMLPGCHCSLDTSGCLRIEIEGEKRDRYIFNTRDMAEITAPDEFRILGRADNVINSGGVKLHPEELENEILNHLAKHGMEPVFMVCGRSSERWGHEAVMVLEGVTEEMKENIKSILSKSMSHIRLPKDFISVDTLPRTSSGKVIRRIQTLI